LTDTYAKDPKLVGLVDSVISTVQRCAKVTRDLLNFTRHLNLSIQAIDLNEIIYEVKSVLTKEAELRSITVEITVSEDIPTFESDRGKLEQVFFNLFNSAIGAMSDGGHLEITATRKNENYVSVAFTDNGRGIPESDLKLIFEPFYYSKTGHSGTGLGLSVTYALVQELGGTISVQSRPGQETVFDISIPLERPGTSSSSDQNNTV
jgi:signal transduction histidine kinase